MTCPNCGRPINDSARFCPYCGFVRKTANSDSYTVPLYPDGGANPTVPVNRSPQMNPTVPVNGKKPKAGKDGAHKSKKRILIPIVAVVLTVALVVTGVFVAVPYFRSRYAKNNVFAAQIKETKKGTASRDVMTVFASMHNMLFNSKSLTAKMIFDEDEEFFNGRIVFGKDLTTTKALVYLYNSDMSFAMQDGKVILSNQDDRAAQFNVKKLLDDYKSLYDLVPWENAPKNVKSAADKEVDTVKKAVDELFQNKLNIDSLDTILNSLYHVFGKDIEDIDYLFDCEDLTLTAAFEILADYIAQMPDDIITIKASKQDHSVKYKYSFDGPDLLSDLIDFVLDSEKANEMLSKDAMTGLKDYRKELKDSEFTIKGEAVVQDNYLTKLTAGEEDDDDYWEIFELTVSNVNKTEIDDAKLKKVFSEVDEEDMLIVENVDDMEDFIENGYDFYTYDDDDYDDDDDYYDDDDDYYDDDDDYYDDDDDYYDDDDDYYDDDDYDYYGY